MKQFAAPLLCCLSLSNVRPANAEPWKPVEGHLLTRWAKDVRPATPLPEYPRPQLVRPDWHNLNGLWEYAITPAGATAMPDPADDLILVPYCLESALSGVKKPLPPDHALWYRRTFQVPPAWDKQRLLLHFGAVDWHAQVWVNNKLVGEHRGGYTPFTIDVTDALVPEEGKPQLLVVKVLDPTDDNWQPRGKQVRKPEGIWYTAVSGIWQTVWLEPVPPAHIRGLRMEPDVRQSAIVVTPSVSVDKPVRFEVFDGEKPVAAATLEPGRPTRVALPKPQLWSPQSPHLYRVKATLVDDTSPGDAVESYFGMREISLGTAGGHTRLLLNGEPLFQFGPLDQGWWPDGLYTAPTDEALVYDLEILRKLGMNMLRKHVKVEPDRYYYHCDRLGLLVWQDMPSGDKYIGAQDPDISRSPESAKNFEAELAAMIDALRNHPCIVMWVVYNEGWGQWDTARMARWTAEYDRARLVNATSGWTDRGVGHVIDMHAYPGPNMLPAEPHRASVLGEFGGLGWPVEGHLWQDKKNWGYRTYASQEELQAAYLQLIEQLRKLIGQGLSAAVYTQTTDVEIEVNGLMTYDRAVLKLEPAALAEAHRKLYAPISPEK